MESKVIAERASLFLSELGVPVTKFCERVKIGVSTFYAWQAGTLKLSEATLERIDSYLTKYNF